MKSHLSAIVLFFVSVTSLTANADRLNENNILIDDNGSVKAVTWQEATGRRRLADGSFDVGNDICQQFGKHLPSMEEQLQLAEKSGLGRIDRRMDHSPIKQMPGSCRYERSGWYEDRIYIPVCDSRIVNRVSFAWVPKPCELGNDGLGLGWRCPGDANWFLGDYVTTSTVDNSNDVLYAFSIQSNFFEGHFNNSPVAFYMFAEGDRARRFKVMCAD